MRKLATIFFLIILSNVCLGQACSGLGGTPATGIPVCKLSFHFPTVNQCGSNTIEVPGCADVAYTDKNVTWFKIHCFSSGFLGFEIEPVNKNEDYDWQLYDISGRDPNDALTQISTVVSGNWVRYPGNTGAANSGLNIIECATDLTLNSYAKMSMLYAGHTYLLMVSHHTDTQNGFSISFNGSAVITEGVNPEMVSVSASCSGKKLRLSMNKKILCQSLQTNGTEFYIMPGNIPVISAQGAASGCGTGFDTDLIELLLTDSLYPGTYSLVIKNGSDSNTLLDHCFNAVPEYSSLYFTVVQKGPTPMTTMVPVECNPNVITVLFNDPVLCSSIASDGSDFDILGSYPVTISGAYGNCDAMGLTYQINISLAQNLNTDGNFILSLIKGNDNNTVLNECNLETELGYSLAFNVRDTVNAEFSYLKKYGCSSDTVSYFHPGGNGINSYTWLLDENINSNQQNPVAVYEVIKSKLVYLIVSNGFCTDTSAQVIILDNLIKADFTSVTEHCGPDPVTFTSKAKGKIVSHSWNFGDGSSSGLVSPTHVFNQTTAGSYMIQYTVTDSIGCQNSVQKPLTVYSSCEFAIPNAFTPNNDGKNDQLRILNAFNTDRIEFRIFNRYGQLVFYTTDWKNGWDGKYNGLDQGTGVYIWFISYYDKGLKQTRTMKGTATLIR